VDWSHVTWPKSSRSGAGPTCVEFPRLPKLPRRMLTGCFWCVMRRPQMGWSWPSLRPSGMPSSARSKAASSITWS